MSGGYFDHDQFVLRDIIEELEHQLDDEHQKRRYIRGFSESYVAEYPFEPNSKEIKKVIRDAIISLKKSLLYIDKIDYYLSDDISEETLLRDVKEGIKAIEEEYKDSNT